MTTGAEVVAEARTWLGTPYHPRAGVKGMGVDCVHLPLLVGQALGLLDQGLTLPEYVAPDGRTLIELCERHLERVSIPAPGNVAVFILDKEPQHVGILADYPKPGVYGLIHAARKAGRVIETRLLLSRALRLVAAYRYPGL